VYSGAHAPGRRGQAGVILSQVDQGSPAFTSVRPITVLDSFVQKHIIESCYGAVNMTIPGSQPKEAVVGRMTNPQLVAGLTIMTASIIGCSRLGPATSEDTNAELLTAKQSQCAEMNSRVLGMGGPLAIAGICNARYIGALPARNGRHVRPRMLIRSAHLQMVNEQGSAEMTELGIASVIDFRTRLEEAAAPDAPWVMRTTRHLTVELPKTSVSDPNSYVTIQQALEPKLAQVFAHLGVPAALPALLHCEVGRDRTCLAMAIVLLAIGVTPDDVAFDLANNQTESQDPGRLNGVFSRIANAGGIEKYLAANGVARPDIESLQAQALD
jgi:protein-tyrosine phosphatase